jgi:hypothetical protein
MSIKKENKKFKNLYNYDYLLRFLLDAFKDVSGYSCTSYGVSQKTVVLFEKGMPMHHFTHLMTLIEMYDEFPGVFVSESYIGEINTESNFRYEIYSAHLSCVLSDMFKAIQILNRIAKNQSCSIKASDEPIGVAVEEPKECKCE